MTDSEKPSGEFPFPEGTKVPGPSMAGKIDPEHFPTLEEYTRAGYAAETYEWFFGGPPPGAESPAPTSETKTETPSPAARQKRVPSFTYPGFYERK